MTSILKFSASILLMVLLSDSCKEKRAKAEAKEKAEYVKNKEENMRSDGYSLGVLMKNKAASCPVLIVVDEQYLDPINLDDFKISKDSKVWVKYQNLRMQNRCSDGRPVRIESIKKAEI